MVRLPVVESALEGFRLTRERPLAVAVWTGWLFLSAGISSLLMTAPGMAELLALTRAAQGSPPDPAQAAAIAAAVARAWGPVALLFAFNVAVSVVFYTAVLRAVFAPAQAGRAFYLGLGRAEARQAGLAALAALALFGYSLAMSAAAGVLIGLATLAGRAAGLFLGAVVVALLAVALIYPVVRLSLAPPATFTAKRIRLFDTWRATRGLFWPLLGVYALALALAALVYFLALVIVVALALAIATALGGGLDTVRTLFAPDLSSVRGVISPLSLVSLAFGAAVTTPVYVVTLAAGAGAWRHLPAEVAAAPPAR